MNILHIFVLYMALQFSELLSFLFILDILHLSTASSTLSPLTLALITPITIIFLTSSTSIKHLFNSFKNYSLSFFPYVTLTVTKAKAETKACFINPALRFAQTILAFFQVYSVIFFHAFSDTKTESFLTYSSTTLI